MHMGGGGGEGSTLVGPLLLTSISTINTSEFSKVIYMYNMLPQIVPPVLYVPGESLLHVPSDAFLA